MNVGTTTWPWLRNLNAYRLALATVLALSPILSGTIFSPAYRGISLFYLLVSVISGIFYLLRRPGFRTQVITQILFDLVVLTALMHASGGINSGLGILLVIAVAGGSLLLPGRTAYLFAALATLCVLASQGFILLTSSHVTAADFVRAGLLGIALFATALLSHLLARRIHESESLAEQRGIDLANLTQLNEYVIKRLQAGIVVVDRDLRIRLINETGWRLMGLGIDPTHTPLVTLSPELTRQLSQWQRDPLREPVPFRPGGRASEVSPNFLSLQPGTRQGTLILLEDAGMQARAAQQEKLAALGRLTGGIAHEIRNPLAAINHASQLLSESAPGDAECLHLCDIIQNQSQRVNGIVESILNLSRREPARREPVPLAGFLERFVQEFRAANEATEPRIQVTSETPDLAILFDSGQLRQVLDNLCQNAALHGREAGEPASITIAYGPGISDRGWLEVRDRGPGVPSDQAESIFEPFQTSRAQGTGLGLYIARELCEHNQASLTLAPATESGTCFRIDFEQVLS